MQIHYTADEWDILIKAAKSLVSGMEHAQHMHLHREFERRRDGWAPGFDGGIVWADRHEDLAIQALYAKHIGGTIT